MRKGSQRGRKSPQRKSMRGNDGGDGNDGVAKKRISSKHRFGMERTPLEKYTIVLQAMPSDVPVLIRLRRVLKIAGRAYDLRCVRCEPGDRMRPAGDGDQTDGRAA